MAELAHSVTDCTLLFPNGRAFTTIHVHQSSQSMARHSRRVPTLFFLYVLFVDTSTDYKSIQIINHTFYSGFYQVFLCVVVYVSTQKGSHKEKRCEFSKQKPLSLRCAPTLSLLFLSTPRRVPRRCFHFHGFAYVRCTPPPALWRSSCGFRCLRPPGPPSVHPR